MKIAWQDLLNRLTDLDALTLPPPPGERSGCVSSTDRRSRYDASSGTYVDWGANDDGTGYVRTLDAGGIVACELDGPGTLTRVWSAMPGTGHIRIFIDDEKVMDRPFIEMFTRFGADFAPLNLPNVCPVTSRGYNSYLPIPFQKRLRVEFAEGWGAYYQFTYTLFPQDAVVPRYQDIFSRENRIALAKLDRRLWLRTPGGFPNDSASVQLPPARETTIWEATGRGKITRVRLRAANPNDANGIILRVYWDGDPAPAALAPLPDFFGGRANPFSTLVSGLNGGVWYADWVMPYANGARITAENLHLHPMSISAFVETAPCPDASERLRFFARWTRGDWAGMTAAERLRFQPGGDRWPDWPLLRLPDAGVGRFCGFHLRVLDTWKHPVQSPQDAWWFNYPDDPTQPRGDWFDWWWGEGDEKFFVDGEKFPSTFGTGSEDYFGYAWAAEPPFALFDAPFAANSDVPLDGNGVTSAVRFQVADNVPFRRGFEAYLEKYKSGAWCEGGVCRFAATAYGYAANPLSPPESVTAEHLSTMEA
ncbi:MAG: DUF2961 domain-containing protein [Oscillospiraceae bacterium]|jgi:hypothetical protein|nr:DUF2961 domain-containing protein [Oscillospiraceae bacterium]